MVHHHPWLLSIPHVATSVKPTTLRIFKVNFFLIIIIIFLFRYPASQCCFQIPFLPSPPIFQTISWPASLAMHSHRGVGPVALWWSGSWFFTQLCAFSKLTVFDPSSVDIADRWLTAMFLPPTPYCHCVKATRVLELFVAQCFYWELISRFIYSPQICHPSSSACLNCRQYQGKC